MEIVKEENKVAVSTESTSYFGFIKAEKEYHMLLTNQPRLFFQSPLDLETL
jgi:hypothetical protein